MSFHRILGAWALIFSLMAGVCWGENHRAEELYKKGLELAIQGKFAEAQTAFEQSWKIEKIEMGSPFPSELALKGINDAMQGKVSRKAAVHFFKGTNYQHQGRREKAIAEFNQGLQLSPSYAPLYFSRGNAYLNKSEKEQALADLTKSLQLDPGYWLAYYLRGFLYFIKDNYDLAIADFNEALRLHPKFVMAYYYRGLAYGRKDLYDQAISDFSKILELVPDFVLAYLERANAHVKKNPSLTKSQAEKAIADYKKAVELEPRLWEAYPLLAYLYESVGGDKEDIIRALKNLIQYAPPEQAELVREARKKLQSLEAKK